MSQEVQLLLVILASNIKALVQVPALPLCNLAANVPGKAIADVLRAWVPASCMGDQEGGACSWLRPAY